MKGYGGVDVEIQVFMKTALVGGEWSASCPCRFTPGESYRKMTNEREYLIKGRQKEI
jgi:hypothetical protein